MLLRISPINDLFFGTHKGFTSRNHDTNEKIRNNWHPTSDIPLPSVFYGAVASRYLGENPEILKKYNPNPSNKKFIKIGRIFIEDNMRKEIYINAPLNFLITSDDEHQEIFDKNLCYDNLQTAENFFVDINCFYKYFKIKKHMKLLKKDDLFSHSYKVGIHLKDKEVVENYLYRSDTINLLKDIEEESHLNYLIEVDIEGMDNFSNEGILKLGGENGFCKYEIVNTNLPSYNYEKDFKNENSIVVLYFFSPVQINPNYDHTVFELKIFTQKILISHGYNIGKGNTDRIKKKQPYMQRGTVIFIKNLNFKDKKSKEIKDIIADKSNGIFTQDISGINIFDIFSIDTHKDKYNLNEEELYNILEDNCVL